MAPRRTRSEMDLQHIGVPGAYPEGEFYTAIGPDGSWPDSFETSEFCQYSFLMNFHLFISLTVISSTISIKLQSTWYICSP